MGFDYRNKAVPIGAKIYYKINCQNVRARPLRNLTMCGGENLIMSQTHMALWLWSGL